MQPTVTVIVPAFNAANHVGRCLNALLAQDYPRDRLELLVVDNGSTDGTAEIARSRATVRVCTESVRSSYVARNTGVSRSSGEIVAFCDADCVPVPSWVSEGVRALMETGAGLAAGRVVFDLGERPTGAQLFDALSNMQIEENVREQHVAKTANLFVRRELFGALGSFPAVVSGGDVIWTGRATGAGHALVYAPDATVAHPARRLRELVAKSHRVGRGQPSIRAANPERRRRGGRGLLPPSPRRLRRRLAGRGLPSGPVILTRVVAAGLVARWAHFLGSLKGDR